MRHDKIENLTLNLLDQTLGLLREVRNYTDTPKGRFSARSPEERRKLIEDSCVAIAEITGELTLAVQEQFLE